MVLQIILADILLVARIFPRPCGARKNTTQLVKYPRVLSVKPSNKVYVLLFIVLHKVVLTFESVDEIQKCDHSNESYQAVLSCAAVYCAAQGDFNF